MLITLFSFAFGYLVSLSSCAAFGPDLNLSKRHEYQYAHDAFGNPKASDCRAALSLMPRDQATRLYYGSSDTELPDDGRHEAQEKLPRDWTAGSCIIRVVMDFGAWDSIHPEFDETSWQVISDEVEQVIGNVVEAQGKGGYAWPETYFGVIMVQAFAKDSEHDKYGPLEPVSSQDSSTDDEEDVGLTSPHRVNAQGPSEARQQLYGNQGSCEAVYCILDRDCVKTCGEGNKCGGSILLNNVAAALVNFGAQVISSIGAEVCSSV